MTDPLNNYFGRRGTIFVSAVFCFLSPFGGAVSQTCKILEFPSLIFAFLAVWSKRFRARLIILFRGPAVCHSPVTGNRYGVQRLNDSDL